MAFLFFLLNVLLFFVVLYLTNWLYNTFIRSYLDKFRLLAPIISIITIMIWMISPSHWIVLVLFAITAGIYLAENKEKKQKGYFTY